MTQKSREQHWITMEREIIVHGWEMISRSVTISKIFHKIKSKLKSKLEEHDLMNHEERCSACAQKTKKNNKFQKPEDALVKRTLT